MPIAFYAGITISDSAPRLSHPGFYTLEYDVLSWLRIVACDVQMSSSLTMKSSSYDGVLFSPHELIFDTSKSSDPVSDRASPAESQMTPAEELMLEHLCKATDKFEAAIAMQPEATRRPQHGQSTASTSRQKAVVSDCVCFPCRESRFGFSDLSLSVGELLFKFGTFIPRNDREANASPEAHRWKVGRDLEWLRLNEQGTFEVDWDLARVYLEHPEYKKSDIGHCFYVYDYKFSGEHRVRLVFDGSR